MRSLILAVVFFAVLAGAAPAAGGTKTSRSLFFDAGFTRARTAGPAANSVGHLQIGGGVLRDADGRAVGTFAFTCRWVKMLPGDDALERCSGWGRSADGKIDVAGPSRRSEPTHTWTVTGGTDAYRDARGTLVVRDVGNTESLVLVTISTRPGVALSAGVLAGLAEDESFRASASGLCKRAGAKLAGLPRFPFSDFDALHPDPSLLPRVGRFFTGPHDARPILRSLLSSLRALGTPPANVTRWRALLDARSAQLALMEQQDKAALAKDVSAFVRTVAAGTRTNRRVAFTSTVFGAPGCVL